MNDLEAYQTTTRHHFSQASLADHPATPCTYTGEKYVLRAASNGCEDPDGTINGLEPLQAELLFASEAHVPKRSSASHQ